MRPVPVCGRVVATAVARVHTGDWSRKTPRPQSSCAAADELRDAADRDRLVCETPLVLPEPRIERHQRQLHVDAAGTTVSSTSRMTAGGLSRRAPARPGRCTPGVRRQQGGAESRVACPYACRDSAWYSADVGGPQEGAFRFRIQTRRTLTCKHASSKQGRKQCRWS